MENTYFIAGSFCGPKNRQYVVPPVYAATSDEYFGLLGRPGSHNGFSGYEIQWKDVQQERVQVPQLSPAFELLVEPAQAVVEEVKKHMHKHPENEAPDIFR